MNNFALKIYEIGHSLDGGDGSNQNPKMHSIMIDRLSKPMSGSENLLFPMINYHPLYSIGTPFM